MAATEEEIKLCLRFLVDRERKKVVFAEAESDFVDTLFSFLTLPMGTIVRILKNHSDLESGSIGSFKTLYEGVQNLDTKHLWTEECKTMLLNPRNWAENECCNLKLNIDNTEPTKYFICKNWGCSCGSTASVSTRTTVKCSCGNLMNRAVIVDSNVSAVHGEGGVFVIETASFIISDDLHVIPNLPDNALGLLKDLEIRDIGVLEEISMDIGFKEVK